MQSEPLLAVRNLKKYFPAPGSVLGRGPQVHAVESVSFEVNQGETLGLVGESGCGKSTLSRCLLRLIEPSAGEVRYRGTDMLGLDRRGLRELRRHVQMIFQDPYASFNPRRRIGVTLGEPLAIYGVGSPAQRKVRIAELLQQVGLPPTVADVFPHQLSGGQLQRVAIAAALALDPELIIADEPLSALDVSVQAQVLNLLTAIQRRRGLAFLLISHNLGVVRYFADRVAVMYLGAIVEIGPTSAVFARPQHPYTRALIASIPAPDPATRVELAAVEGDLPSPLSPPPGCRFHTRCPHTMPICRQQAPELRLLEAGHAAACWLHDQSSGVASSPAFSSETG